MKRIVLVILFVLAATLSGMPACSDLLFPSCGGLFTACDADSPCCEGLVCDFDGLCRRPAG
jgi:hypothetical protein